MMNDRFRRTLVIGPSCSGKSTLARQLAGTVDATHIELDLLFWNPGWQQTPVDDFRGAVESAVARDRWVIDGNYFGTLDLTIPRATAIVWLDLPLRTVLWQVVRRSVVRAWRKTPVCGGNHETMRHSFLSRESIILWVLTSHRQRRRKCLWVLTSHRQRRRKCQELRDEIFDRDKLFVELKNHQESAQFLEELADKATREREKTRWSV